MISIKHQQFLSKLILLILYLDCVSCLGILKLLKHIYLNNLSLFWKYNTYNIQITICFKVVTVINYCIQKLDVNLFLKMIQILVQWHTTVVNFLVSRYVNFL